MDFTNLTPTDFEELCFDLLNSIGCKNVDWRKGTGLNSSPSDKGRDIECEYYRYDVVLGEMVVEKWFVECKHYKEGISPNVLSGATQWAVAEKPDRLLIMTTSFLTNPCKEWINKFSNSNSLKISVWEKPRIEKLLCTNEFLLKKYKIRYLDEVIQIMDDVHIEFIKTPTWNTLEQLEEYFSTLSDKSKKMICEIESLYYIRDISFDEISKSYGKCEIVEIIFDRLKKIASVSSEQFAVNSFIHQVLSDFIHAGNSLKVDDILLENNKLLVSMKTNKKQIAEKAEMISGQKFDDYEEIIEDLSRKLNRSPEQVAAEVQESYSIYKEFCNKVVRNLIEVSK